MWILRKTTHEPTVDIMQGFSTAKRAYAEAYRCARRYNETAELNGDTERVDRCGRQPEWWYGGGERAGGMAWEVFKCEGLFLGFEGEVI